MKTTLFFTSIFIFLSLQTLKAQNKFDIVFPQANRDEVCQSCTRIFQQKPKEVKFSIVKDKANNLYFEVNNKQWFNQLFKNSGDGIAIDVVTKERYDCMEATPEASQIRGELLRPVYSAVLKKKLRPSPQGKNRFRTRVGKLSASYTGKDVEFNILFLSNKNLCRYQTIFNLQAYQWGLLDMGMYLDSLTYKTKLNALADKESFTLKHKNLQFTIPFEKNKSNYSQEDIKPLYDSLRLTDYYIKKINIRAYSSVEGNLERNLELQEQRANSIVSALQTFQKPTIITEVSSSENWVEFLNDISNTEHEQLKNQKKAVIKSKLNAGLSNTLEHILKNHRKAVINLELEKIDRYKDKNISMLIKLFNEVLGQEKVDEAIEIQNSIFEKLKDKQTDPNVLNQMNIPRQLKYTLFFNKNAAFRYLMNERNLLIAYGELQDLEKLAPKNGKVKYNLAALKFTIWKHNVQSVNEQNFKKQILTLKNYGISKALVNRMLVNYHIVKSEKYLRKQDYVNKDKSVDYIYANYKNVPLTDYDYLSLAQFLAYYSNIDKAVNILANKVKSIDVIENLLFYYLNLTLIDKELTKTTDYRTIMLNALNMNKTRFCSIFNALEDGGVTFQLLEDDFLRETYCENCNDQK
ncbi:MAG: hypothetical protein COB60_04240 [Flavobacteriaceae bacterium]|nr:MAG: hypothetical protein COB60_04240 [Flavobacteriaceae bacterium]